MKSMIKMLGLGLILFGVSATASYFLLTPKPVEPVEETDELVQAEKPATPGDLSEDVFQQPPIEPVDHPVKQETIPVAAYPPSKISFDVVTKLSESIMNKEKVLARREEMVTKSEQRLKFVVNDIQREKGELADYAKLIDQKTQYARELLDKLKQERSALMTERTEFVKIQKSSASANPDGGNQPSQNFKMVQGWLQGMDADNAAKFVRTIADSGELKSVSTLLKGMEQRKVADILTALGDEVLARQILEMTMKGN